MKFLAAVVQLCSTPDVSANLATAIALLADIRSQSKDVKAVFSPESVDYIAENAAQSQELAQPLDGPFVTALCQAAKEHDLAVFLGVHEKIVDNNSKPHNCLVSINNQGEIVDVYRRLHLFDMNAPDQKLKESDSCEPGNKINIPLKTSLGNIGMAICYDLRFSELSLQLRKLGTNILLYPSAFTVNTEIILPTRALQTRCYVIAAAQTGVHNLKRSSYGRATAINPYGKILAKCHGKIPFELFTIDTDLVNKTRGKYACF